MNGEVDANAENWLQALVARVRALLPSTNGLITEADLDGFVTRNYPALLALARQKLPPTPPAEPPRTAAVRTAANLEAMHLAARKRSWEMDAADLAVLARYTGWGGLSLEKVAEKFPRDFPVPDTAALIHEYYTPENVAREVVRAVDRLLKLRPAPTARALEPSAGIGRFLGAASESAVLSRFAWDAVEWSETSAIMCTARFGASATVWNESFEAFVAGHLPDLHGQVGLVLANPPYGNRGASYTEDPDRSYREKRAYAYFLRRCTDLLAPGGLAVFLIPAGFLTGASNRDLRAKVFARNNLSAAFRLPSGLFPGAMLVTDLLFLRARNGELEDFVDEDQRIVDGDYFNLYPHHILGTERGGATDDDDQTRKPRFGYQVDGEFTALPSFEERPECEGCVLTPRAASKLVRSAAKALSEAGEAAAELGPRVADFLSRVSRRMPAASLRLELLDALNGWRSIWSPAELKKDRHDPRVGQFLSAWENDDQVVEAIREPTASADVDLSNVPRVELLERAFAHANAQGYNEQPGVPVLSLGETPEGRAALHDLSPDGMAALFDAGWIFRLGQVVVEDVRRDMIKRAIWSGFNPIPWLYQALERPTEIAGSERGSRTMAAYVLSPARAMSRGLTTLLNDLQETARVLSENAAEYGKLAVAMASAATRLREARRVVAFGDVPRLPRAGWYPADTVLEFIRIQVRKVDVSYPNRLEEALGNLRLSRMTNGNLYLYFEPMPKVLRDRGAPEGPWPDTESPWVGRQVVEALIDAWKLTFGDESARALRWVYGWFVNDRKLFNPRAAKGSKKSSDELRDDEVTRWMIDWYDKFLASSDDHKRLVEEAYAESLGDYVLPTYSGAPIEIGRWKGNRVPHPHQNAAVRRVKDQRGGIIAFDVGVGKTMTAILLIALARQEGWARRPVVLAPNSVAMQWVREARRCIPDIRLAVIGWDEDGNGKVVKDDANRRGAKWRAFMAGRYDFVILTHSNLDRTTLAPDPQEWLANYLEENPALSTHVDGVAAAGEGEKKKKTEKPPKDPEKLARWLEENRLREEAAQNIEKIAEPTERARAVMRERRRQWVAEMVEPAEGQKPDAGVTWQDLGVDLLIVDEAQNFKNLYGPPPRQGGIKFMGGQAEGSARAFALDFRAAQVRAANGVVCLLSATPAKNSPLEFYNLCQFVDAEAWRRAGVFTATQFVDAFIVLRTELVMDSDLSMRPRTAAVGFQNLDLLRDVLFRMSEFKTADELPWIKLPEAKVTQEYVPMTEAQEAAYERLADEAVQMLKSGQGHALRGVLMRMGLIAVHPSLEHAHHFEVDPDTKEQVRIGYSWSTALEIPEDKYEMAPKFRALFDHILLNNTCGHVVFCDFTAVHRWAITELARYELVRWEVDGVQCDERAMFRWNVGEAISERDGYEDAANTEHLLHKLAHDARREPGVVLRASIAIREPRPHVLPPRPTHPALAPKITLEDLDRIEATYNHEEALDNWTTSCDAIIAAAPKQNRVVSAQLVRMNPERVAVLNAETAKRADDRAAIADAFNGDPDAGVAPTIDVIFANAVAYEGINLQVRTCEMHHLDLPWEPATLQQRNGRGVRQGNKLEAIAVRYYLAERSFDAVRLGQVAGKLGWMNALLKGHAKSTNNPGAQSDLSTQDVQRLLARDPIAAARAMLKAQAQAERERAAAELLNGMADFRVAMDLVRQAAQKERTSPGSGANIYAAARTRLDELGTRPSWPWAFQHEGVLKARPMLWEPIGRSIVAEGQIVAKHGTFALVGKIGVMHSSGETGVALLDLERTSWATSSMTSIAILAGLTVDDGPLAPMEKWGEIVAASVWEPTSLNADQMYRTMKAFIEEKGAFFNFFREYSHGWWAHACELWREVTWPLLAPELEDENETKMLRVGGSASSYPPGVFNGKLVIPHEHAGHSWAPEHYAPETLKVDYFIPWTRAGFDRCMEMALAQVSTPDEVPLMRLAATVRDWWGRSISMMMYADERTRRERALEAAAATRSDES